MRLRVFEAATAREALEAARRALGPDAAILATVREGDRVRVTAAVDLEAAAPEEVLGPPDGARVAGEVESCLDSHRPLRPHLVRLVEAATACGIGEAEPALAHALAALGPFGRIDPAAEGPLAVVGPPGAGKTTLLVRLAAAMHLCGRPVRVLVAADSQCGARERLAALLRPLGIAPGTDGEAAADRRSGRLLDTAGVNPFDARELTAVLERARSGGFRPLLVLPACTDAGEAFDVASNFAALGVRRAVVTGLDRTRRLGAAISLLAAGVALCGATVGPYLDRLLVPLTPAGLARMLLRGAAGCREQTS